MGVQVFPPVSFVISRLGGPINRNSLVYRLVTTYHQNHSLLSHDLDQ